ncbi:MAG: RDD family protein [SAR324 cluster bacterium]|nr:RDD family protein [SAR324 cluster bacterium]
MSQATKEKPELPKLQVASPGKRLFALIFDFIVALLVSNTLQHSFREEHWDLVRREQTWIELLPFYAGLLGLLVIRDVVRGVSPGKLLLGLSARSREAILTPLDARRGLLRGLPLVAFPLEGIQVLWDLQKGTGLGRRFGDRWANTVVIENPTVLRYMLRILLANTILFGFFGAALLLQDSTLRKTAAYQATAQHLRTHPDTEALLARYPELNEPELSLDLRSESGLSEVRLRIGPPNEDSGHTATLKLQFVERPTPRWEVVELRLEEIREEN